jgi:hypothetical protein
MLQTTKCYLHQSKNRTVAMTTSSILISKTTQNKLLLYVVLTNNSRCLLRLCLNSCNRCQGNDDKEFSAPWLGLLAVQPYLFRLTNNCHDPSPHPYFIVLEVCYFRAWKFVSFVFKEKRNRESRVGKDYVRELWSLAVCFVLLLLQESGFSHHMFSHLIYFIKKL